jgi:hypothetical protein
LVNKALEDAKEEVKASNAQKVADKKAAKQARKAEVL